MVKVGNGWQQLHSPKYFTGKGPGKIGRQNCPNLGNPRSRSSNHPFFRSQKCEVSGYPGSNLESMPPINPHDFTSIPLRGKRRKVAAQARSHDIWETPSRLGAEEPGTQIPPFFVAFSWLGIGILFQKRRDIASLVEVRTCFG